MKKLRTAFVLSVRGLRPQRSELMKGRVRGSGRRVGLLLAVVFLVAGSGSLSEPPGAASASTISYTGRLASGKSSTSSTTANVTTTRAVTAGDALFVAAMLNGTAAGVVSARDSAGNVYT